MQPLTDIYGKVISRANLYAAARAATSGKRFKNAVARFNFLREGQIDRLRRDLLDKTYRHGAYTLIKIYDPKERQIAASPFRDRVVHHAIHDLIEPVIDKTFIFDSYACRSGKGTHKALERAQAFLRANRYCLHGDIKKYFPSVDHAVLKKIIRLKIQDADLLDLIDQIIDSANHASPVPGRGLPIGNLTSQFFANLYLNELDRFMKFTLKQRYYIRYMDDFLVFGNDLRQLKDIRQQAQVFLKAKLCLTMHESKSQIFKTSRGLKFLGLRLFEGHRRLASDNVRRLRRRLDKVGHEGLKSWLAYAQNADTVLLRRRILGHASGLLQWRHSGLTVVLWMLLAGSAWAQYVGGSGSGDSYGRYPPALLASTSQSFAFNGASASAGTIEVMQDTAGAGTGITTSGGIQISIPSGLNMTWDPSITTATITGGAQAKVSTAVSYANSNTTLIITVSSNFNDGDVILISGLNFTNFNSLSNAGGQLMLDIGASYGYDADNSLQWITGGPYYGGSGSGDSYGRYPPVLLATTGQSFVLNGASTSAGTIEVKQDTAGTGTGITTSSGLKIDIPAGLNMTWDPSITTATISGGAQAKVSTAVSYANSNTTLVLTVSSNFNDGDVILISGLNFTNFGSFSTAGGQLMLDTGASYGYDADNSLQWITGGPYYGGSGDGDSDYDFQTQQGQMSYAGEF